MNKARQDDLKKCNEALSKLLEEKKAEIKEMKEHIEMLERELLDTQNNLMCGYDFK